MKTQIKQPTKKELRTQASNMDEQRAIEILSLTFDQPEKILALSIELQIDMDDAINTIKEDAGDEMFSYGSRDYYVLTDREAENKNDESIESYIDDCVLHEIPKHLQQYFDYDAFKADAEQDGRGHNLAAYDGYELTQTVNRTEYYIYRWN